MEVNPMDTFPGLPFSGNTIEAMILAPAYFWYAMIILLICTIIAALLSGKWKSDNAVAAEEPRNINETPADWLEDGLYGLIGFPVGLVVLEALSLPYILVIIFGYGAREYIPDMATALREVVKTILTIRQKP